MKALKFLIPLLIFLVLAASCAGACTSIRARCRRR